MVGLNELNKKQEGTKSIEQLKQYHIDNETNKFKILNAAANGKKYRYESDGNIEKFLDYLKKSVGKWEHLSNKGGNGTHYAKCMLVKTNTLIEKLSAELCQVP